MPDNDGRQRLKDLARVVRDKVTPVGAPLLDKRGLDMVETLARDLTGSDGMPGLKLWRDAPTKFRLQRANRNAEISIEWQRDIGAVVMTVERVGQRRRQVRFIHDEAQDQWRPLDGGDDLYAAIAAALVEALYPEGRPSP
jgi:hypothetical protein